MTISEIIISFIISLVTTIGGILVVFKATNRKVKSIAEIVAAIGLGLILFSIICTVGYINIARGF